jgi:hypothetical protein
VDTAASEPVAQVVALRWLPGDGEIGADSREAFPSSNSVLAMRQNRLQGRQRGVAVASFNVQRNEPQQGEGAVELGLFDAFAGDRLPAFPDELLQGAQ